MRIYLSVPHMGSTEESYVREAFATNWLSSVGPNLDAFERDFTARHEGRPCVALASGTAALHLGLRLLDVGPGDEIFSSTLTFVASANTTAYLGARPVFIDSDRSSWNMDPELLEEALKERAAKGKLPRAVVVVHLYGQSADMDRINAACARWGVTVIEDAAEALGATYKGRPVGVFSPISAFSFNGNKIITTTGGGMLACEKKEHVEKARFWSTQARNPGIAYDHTEMGYNYRLSNVLAGIGRGQLEVLDERVRQRRAVFERYQAAFAEPMFGGGLEAMPEAEFGSSNRWLSVFLVDERALGASRDALIAALAREDIESRPVWKPMHIQPLYADAPRFGGAVAEDLFARGICLPSSSSLTHAEQDRVVDILRRVVSERPAGAGRARDDNEKRAACAT